MTKPLTMLILLILLSISPTATAVDYPQLTGFVTDDANMIDPEYEVKITELVKKIEGATTVEIAVVTVESLEGESKEVYAAKLFEQAGIGKKDKDNGLLILVAKQERKYRFEVGYGLEGVITDSMKVNIGDKIITPNFRSGEYGRGIYESMLMIEGLLEGDSEAISEYSINNQGNTGTSNGWIGILIFLIIASSILVSMWWRGGGRRSTSTLPPKPVSSMQYIGSTDTNAPSTPSIHKIDPQIPETEKAIRNAESTLQNAMIGGVNISQSTWQLLRDAQKAFAAEDFAVAKAKAEEFREEQEQRVVEPWRKRAAKQIKSAKSSIEKAERLGITVQHAKELNIEAQSSFDANDYSSATNYAEQSRDAAEKLIDESKPSISIELPPKMQYNHWKRRDLTVTNKGAAPARDVAITFLTALEVRELEVIKKLDTGERETINVNIKPTEKGEVPVDYSVKFSDHQEREYETKDTATV